MTKKFTRRNIFAFSFEQKLLAYLLLLAVIISSIVVIYLKLNNKYKISREQLVYTENILRVTDSIRSYEKDIIIDTRGFIITRDTKFLALFNYQYSRIRVALNQLKQYTSANPVQKQRADSIDSGIREYLAIRERSVTYGNHSNYETGKVALLIHQSESSLNRLEKMFDRFESSEKTILAERKKNYQKNMQRSVASMQFLLVIFIVSLPIAFLIIYKNFIKRNNAVSALKETQSLIRNIIDNSPILINVKDREGRYILANNQFAAILNSTPTEMAGKKSSAFVSEETAEFISRVSKEDDEVLRSKSPSEFQSTLYTRSGEHSFIISKFPLFDSKGDVYAIGSAATDITPIKQAHEALLKSYERQQKILNGIQQVLSASTDLLCIINEMGEFVMLSDTVQQLLGYRSKELMSKKFIDYVIDEDKQVTEQTAIDIMTGKAINSFTNRYKRKDGSIVPITWSFKWVDDDKMMYCIARNATEKILTERQLSQSQSRLAHAQSIARLGSWDWDINNEEWSCSDEIYNLLSIPNGTTANMQKIFLSSIHPDDQPTVYKLSQDALKNGGTINIEHRLITADNKLRYVHSIGEVTLNKDGVPVWFSGTMQDITERKKAELELQKLNEDLEKRAVELKTTNEELERFAYVASHDLQEPLRMVSSFLALLQKRIDSDLDETSKKYIHFATDGAERMKKLIQDLLQFSRIGTSKTDLQRVDLNEIMLNVLQTFEDSIKENHAIIKTGNLPVITGNKTQLTQLFQNLVGNALKYRTSENPVIEVSCKDNKQTWLFTIKDNGIGIDKRFFDKIFIIFQRLHNKNDYSGTGIGLAICKKIVERHGGSIWVKSAPGEGSCFYFTLKKSTHE
jgi:PAS domain S-box-containing protein